jgi:hypothetical protein
MELFINCFCPKNIFFKPTDISPNNMDILNKIENISAGERM